MDWQDTENRAFVYADEGWEMSPWHLREMLRELRRENADLKAFVLKIATAASYSEPAQLRELLTHPFFKR